MRRIPTMSPSGAADQNASDNPGRPVVVPVSVAVLVFVLVLVLA